MMIVATLVPGTAMLADVPLEVIAEMCESAPERFGRAGRERAERVARTEQPRVGGERVEVRHLAAALLEIAEDVGHPVQARPARRAPAARFLREELLEIA